MFSLMEYMLLLQTPGKVLYIQNWKKLFFTKFFFCFNLFILRSFIFTFLDIVALTKKDLLHSA